MRTFFSLLFAALLTLAPAPATAGAASFVLVNGTSLNLEDLAIRRFGSGEWKALALAPSAGSRGPVEFSDPDCAFDIRAQAGTTRLVWSGVNLCEAKIVTLRRDDRSGGLWVEYD